MLWRFKYWRFKCKRRRMEYEAFIVEDPQWSSIKYENYLFGVWD